MGLVPYLFYAAPAAIPTALVWWGQRKAKKHRQSDKPMLKEIHEQVQNSHTTNLREDMDRMEGLLTDGFARMDRRFERLEDELLTERKERIAGDQRGR